MVGQTRPMTIDPHELRGEVSCRSVEVVLAYCEKTGIPAEDLLNDVPYSRDQLRAYPKTSAACQVIQAHTK
jgi:hypothetical protein